MVISFVIKYHDRNTNLKLVGWLRFTSHRQRGQLGLAPPPPPFNVPCEGREARFYMFPPGILIAPGRRVAVHYTTSASLQLNLFSCDDKGL